MTSVTSEPDTPSSFDLSYDEKVPQRELTDFVVSRADEKVSICVLDQDNSSKRPVIAKGTLVAHGKTLKVISAPLTEWCIEYGTNPRLWIRSKHVWYRLTKPAKDYAKIHETARRRFELCSRIYILATTMPPEDCAYKVFAQLLQRSYGSMKGYSEKDILTEKDFIIAQVRSLADESIMNNGFIKQLKEKKVPGKKSSNSKKKESSSANNSSSSKDSSYGGPWRPSGKLDTEAYARFLKRVERVINQIYKSKNAWPFRQPVDPVRDNIPDYFTRIEAPMDYGTIKEKLESGKYTDAEVLANDVRQVTTNCRIFNGDKHEYSVWAMEIQKKFESLMKSAEDAEIAAMSKRNSSKKRKASDALPPTGKSNGKKNGSKVARKGSRSSSGDISSVGSRSPSKDEEPVVHKLCARSETEGCERYQTSGSKYCSDECGMFVARKRIDELSKAGFSVEEYIRQSVTKALVHSRS